MKKFLKRFITAALAFAMLYTAVPIDAHAAVAETVSEAAKDAVGNSVGGEQIVDKEEEYFRENVDPKYAKFSQFEHKNFIKVKLTHADGSILPPNYDTMSENQSPSNSGDEHILSHHDIHEKRL